MGGITTPSSASVVAEGGMDPGREPPISAWCARLATYPRSAPAASCTGVITVTSGRCEPPNPGWLVTTTSPGSRGSAPRTARTQSPSAPRCTGMCGAFTTSSPRGSRSAQEKSSRSLTFIESAVRRSCSPISPTSARKRWVKSSSATASGAARAAASEGALPDRRRTSAPAPSTRASQPSSTTVALWRSTTRAGPDRRAPGARAERSKSGASVQRRRSRCARVPPGAASKGAGSGAGAGSAARVEATTRSDSSSTGRRSGRWP